MKNPNDNQPEPEGAWRVVFFFWDKLVVPAALLSLLLLPLIWGLVWGKPSDGFLFGTVAAHGVGFIRVFLICAWSWTDRTKKIK